MTMLETQREFCDRANDILKQCGIGEFDCGGPALEYDVDRHGRVVLLDPQGCIVVDDWETMSDDDIRREFRNYLGTTGYHG